MFVIVGIVRTLNELNNVRCSVRTVLVRSRNKQRRLCSYHLCVLRNSLFIRNFSGTSLTGAQQGKIISGNVLKKVYFVMCRLMELVEVGRNDYITAATAKVDIRRRGPFEIYSQVNNACSCSEGRRQAVGMYEAVR